MLLAAVSPAPPLAAPRSIQEWESAFVGPCSLSGQAADLVLGPLAGTMLSTRRVPFGALSLREVEGRYADVPEMRIRLVFVDATEPRLLGCWLHAPHADWVPFPPGSVDTGRETILGFRGDAPAPAAKAAPAAAEASEPEAGTSADDGCPDGQVVCGNACIPQEGLCCGSGHYCRGAKYCGLWGNCIPEGSTECSNGKWCRHGFYCGATGCLPEGSSADAAGEACPPGARWKAGGCVPAGSVDCGRRYCPRGTTCGSGETCVPEGAVDCGDGSGAYCPVGTFCPDVRVHFTATTDEEAGIPGVRFGQSFAEIKASHSGGAASQGLDVWKRPVTTYEVKGPWGDFGSDFGSLYARFHFLAKELTSVTVYLPAGSGAVPESEEAMRKARALLEHRYGPPVASSDIGGSYWGFANAIIILERQTATPGHVVPRVEFHRNTTIAGGGFCIPNFLLLRSPEVRRLVRGGEPSAGVALPDAGAALPDAGPPAALPVGH
jgi:hypothetical protein